MSYVFTAFVGVFLLGATIHDNNKRIVDARFDVGVAAVFALLAIAWREPK